MLMTLDSLIDRYELNVTGVFHVGAHHAEELEAYEAAGVPLVVWIEGDKDSHAHVLKRISKLPHHKAVRALVDEKSHIVDFHVANNGQSSSILELGTHLSHHPEVAYTGESKQQTETVDKLFGNGQWSYLNFWNLDVQGVELRVLKGATTALNGCDYIYTEVNAEEVYVGCALVEEIDAFLSDFTRVQTEWTPFKWGDAFYIRKSLL